MSTVLEENGLTQPEPRQYPATSDPQTMPCLEACVEVAGQQILEIKIQKVSLTVFEPRANFRA